MSQGLKLLFYDDTCRTSRFGLGLTHSWIAGARIYGGLGRFHHSAGFTNWAAALAWLATVGDGEPIEEIQYWGHGKWGRLYIDGEVLTASCLDAGHPFHADLEAIRNRMSSDSLWWFRTCETFGAEIGHEFARRWTDFFGCPAAGHTYIIGPLQSGLHALRPGETPDWTTFEGIDEGSPSEPKKALWSVPGAPFTISCVQPNLPSWAFQAVSRERSDG